jgi:hypothetical protein
MGENERKVYLQAIIGQYATEGNLTRMCIYLLH